MIKSTGCKLIVFLLVMMMASPTSFVFAAPKETDCNNEKDSDKRNFCLAKINDRAEGNPLEKDRYRNKDHSAYYCTLIQSRDTQNYCYAMIEKNSKKCELLSSVALEKECKDSIK